MVIVFQMSGPDAEDMLYDQVQTYKGIDTIEEYQAMMEERGYTCELIDEDGEGGIIHLFISELTGKEHYETVYEKKEIKRDDNKFKH